MKKKKDNKHNDLLLTISLILTMAVVGLVVMMSSTLESSPITHEFKNPSFNGIGASAHYLTIDEQETKRRDELAEKIQSELDEIQREIDNSTLNKFLSNLHAF